jgi:hypothetical protein
LRLPVIRAALSLPGLFLLGVLLGGCAQSAPREVSPTADSALAERSRVGAVSLSGDQAADRARIDSLVAVARSIARQDGCSDATGCATMALGVKACGGPKEYLVYCSARTNREALTSAVELVNRLEREFNERYDVVSDCMMVLEPAVAVEGGRCVASGSGAERMP